jgi:hypothetical protein
MYSIYNKLTDNYLVDTQEETRFDLEDTKQLAYQRQKKDTKETSTSSEYIKRSGKISRPECLEQVKIEKSLFNYTYIIGKGGFGKVWRVEHKKTKNQFAMK